MFSNKQSKAFIGAASVLCALFVLAVAQASLAAHFDKDDVAATAELNLFPQIPQQCGPDEEYRAGLLKSDEPTCGNSKPMEHKAFITNLDYVPCFCKEPLLRHPQTQLCVAPSDCPPSRS